MNPATVRLELRFVQQTSGAFEHVVVYNASLEITDDPGQVNVWEVQLANGSDTDLASVYHAVAAIVAGVRAVLEPRGCGANLRVHGLLIHPVDFSPPHFERHTRQALQAELERQG